MSCKPTYKGKRYNSLEELYNANGVNGYRKHQRYTAGFDPSKMSLDEVKPGEFVLSETTQKLLQATENELNKVLGNAFLLPSRREKFSYKLEPIIEGNEWKKDGLGRKLFQLNLVSNNEERPPIQLGNITQGALSKLTAFDIIKNLFLDEQGLPRMRSETEGLVKWQISYNDVRFKDTNPTAKVIIEEILDDDILEISEKSLDYLIHGIGIANPFNNKGELRIQGNDSNPVVVSNPDNANTSSESNEVIKTSLDIEVNTETGQPVEKIKTQPKRKNNTVSKVLQILDTIEESSEELELDEEGGFYISNKTGNRFIRVTSLKEGMSEDNPFALVSSSIGTSVDELIRDIFNDKIKNLIYPNMNQESLDAFIKSILQIKNKLESEGLTIISRDVTLAGNINVTGADGKTTKTLPVAGTLDLLAYDAEGNFVIIDIKSHRGIYSEDKYQQLLSLYKELLLQQGAKVKKLLILSVGVNYADPIGWKNGRVKYTLTNPEATDPLEKLLINAGKKLFDRANPTFEGLMDLNEISLNFEESDLKEEHKALLKENQTKESPKLSSDVVEIAGLPIENFDLGFEDPLSNVLKETSLRFIPERLEWGTWKGFLKDGKPLNIEETKASLALKGITQENWNDRTEEEMEHELLCS